MMTFNNANFRTKLLHWEYWPTWVIYFPVAFYYLFLSVKARNFFFFSLANPQMEMGGLYNCSKFKQLANIPEQFKPKTIYVNAGEPFLQVIERLADIGFPLIAKPDRGERGVGVALIKSQEALLAYHNENNADYLIQEFIEGPFESGVFYYRLPGQSLGVLPSLVVKSFLTVTGDGTSSLEELIFRMPRARLVSSKLLQRGDLDPTEILPAGVRKVLEPIGNHNRGTKFLDGNHLVTKDLLLFFDTLTLKMPGFHYGRFDLRAPSEEAFRNASGIKILEVNGVNAEPAHIYDPDASYWKGIATLLKHWKIIYTISMQNKKQGFVPASFETTLSHYRAWRNQK